MPKQKYQKIITALLLCLSILLIVAGCSSDSAQKSNSTAAYTVTDSQGHKLYFKEKPQRIISMSISTDEILIDLVPSSRIAAFSRLVDDPGISNIVERAQSVGSRVDGQSSEAIMALHPDLILIPDFVKPEVIQSLRDMNLQVYVYKTPKSMEDVRECIRFLGEAVGEKERGEMMVTAMDEHLKKVQDKIGKIPKEKQKRIVFMRSNGAYYSIEPALVEKTKQVIAESMDFCRQCDDFKLCGGGCFARWYGFEDKSAYGAECSMKREAIKRIQK